MEGFATEIYVVNASGGGLRRLTRNLGDDQAPSWSPDGTKIAFTSERHGGISEIFVMNADGTLQTRLTRNLIPDYLPAWGPSGGCDGSPPVGLEWSGPLPADGLRPPA